MRFHAPLQWGKIYALHMQNSRSRLNVVGNMLYCYVIHKIFFCLNTSLVQFQKGHSQSNSSYLQNFISIHCFNFWLSLDNDNFVFIFEVFTLYSTVLWLCINIFSLRRFSLIILTAIMEQPISFEIHIFLKFSRYIPPYSDYVSIFFLFVGFPNNPNSKFWNTYIHFQPEQIIVKLWIGCYLYNLNRMKYK